jgi:hypothetical protein
MPGFRTLVALLLAAVLVSAGEEKKTTADPQKGVKEAKKALNKVFHGKVVKIKKKKVTIYYDFEDPAQLKDFEDARPPRLLDASQTRAFIQGGRLVLEGSSSIRHKMEGRGELRANFFVRVGKQWNVGTVFTEPVMSDYFVVMNLFDGRFYESGMMLLAACGLKEDEGADIDPELVNWRDIVGANLKKKVKVGQDAEIEVYKDGWTEYVRVNDQDWKGSSRGKCKQMDSYQFGFFVHNSRATFDDLTITFELTDEFLDLNNLKAAVDVEWEEVPETGPLAGVRGVPPRIRTQVEEYAAGKGNGRDVIHALLNSGLEKKAREIFAKVLAERRDPKMVPPLIDGLYAEDKLTRKLAIGVIKSIVGKTFGYSPTGGDKARSKAIQKLNSYLAENRSRYFG